MGFLTHTVGAIVNVVENSTGTQGSGAGDWTEQQAAQVEGATDEATGAIQDAASDALGFVQLLGRKVEGRMGQWLSGGIESAGIRAPSQLDLVALLRLSEEVVNLVAGRVDEKLGRSLPAPVVDAARRAAGLAGVAVQRGPAAAWTDVKAELAGARQDALNKLRPIGDKLGVMAEETSPVPAMRQLARMADEERAKLVMHLRQASKLITADLAGGSPPRRSLPLRRSFSSGPEGVELRRLSQELLAAAERANVPIGPQARRHLAEAAAAAARGVVVQSKLLLWLAAIRRAASRSRKDRRP
jgi:uncharacterized protein YjbJ (UPF0337 family)